MTETFSLTVLQAGRPRSRCHQGRAPSETPGRVLPHLLGWRAGTPGLPQLAGLLSVLVTASPLEAVPACLPPLFVSTLRTVG